MPNTNRTDGYCPHAVKSGANYGHCYLSGTGPSQSTWDQKCKSDSNCTTCGNYEAWKNGSNYKNK